MAKKYMIKPPAKKSAPAKAKAPPKLGATGAMAQTLAKFRPK